jgi:hypothetical protein
MAGIRSCTVPWQYIHARWPVRRSTPEIAPPGGAWQGSPSGNRNGQIWTALGAPRFSFQCSLVAALTTFDVASGRRGVGARN